MHLEAEMDEKDAFRAWIYLHETGLNLVSCIHIVVQQVLGWASFTCHGQISTIDLGLTYPIEI